MFVIALDITKVGASLPKFTSTQFSLLKFQQQKTWSCENRCFEAFEVWDDFQDFKIEGSSGHLETIDCLQFLDKDRLASKSADGRIIITDLSSQAQLASWKVRNSCNIRFLIIFVWKHKNGRYYMYVAQLLSNCCI